MKVSSKLNKKQATILEAKNIPGQCPENKDKINQLMFSQTNLLLFMQA